MNNEQKAPTEGIMKKIKALLDKANSTDSLPEKESFMLKAQQMLAQYNIEVHEIVRIGEDGTIKEDTIEYSEAWEKRLMHCVTSNNFCKSIGDWRQIIIIGKPGNIAVCIYLYKFFSNALISESINHYDRYIVDELYKFMKTKKNGQTMEMFGQKLEDTKNNFLQDFMLGGCRGIADKMYEQKKAQMDSNTNFSAIVRVNDSDVEKYVEKHYPNLTYSRAVSENKNGVGYKVGYKVGKGINSYNAVTSAQGRIG